MLRTCFSASLDPLREGITVMTSNLPGLGWYLRPDGLNALSWVWCPVVGRLGRDKTLGSNQDDSIISAATAGGNRRCVGGSSNISSSAAHHVAG